MKNFKLIRIISYILLGLFGISGILTIVFAILHMAKVDTFSTLSSLTCTFGIVACLFGVYKLITSFIPKENHDDFAVSSTITGAALIGFGVFFFLQDSESVLNVIAGKLLPILIACVGFALIIKSIFILCKKGNRMMGFSLLCVGIVCATIGTVFAALDLVDVIWIIVGLLIVVAAIYDIIQVSRYSQK